MQKSYYVPCKTNGRESRRPFQRFYYEKTLVGWGRSEERENSGRERKEVVVTCEVTTKRRISDHPLIRQNSPTLDNSKSGFPRFLRRKMRMDQELLQQPWVSSPFRGFLQLIRATKTFCHKDADPSWLLCDYRTIEHIVEGETDLHKVSPIRGTFRLKHTFSIIVSKKYW